MSGSELVHLNVGGDFYTTTKATLGRYPNSKIGAMFNGSLPITRDENGYYYIDRDGSVFGHILRFLRSSKLTLPSDFRDLDVLADEAEFYQIEPLLQAINERRYRAAINNKLSGSELIHLNVSGVSYTTTKATLTRYPNSMIGSMFNGTMPTVRDERGHYFIDRDGAIFAHVLNFLRNTRLTLPAGFRDHELLAREADFYQIEPLIQAISERRYRERPLLEIREVRTGSTATMPTNNSRIKTIASGRRDVISSLPAEYVGPVEKLQTSNQQDFTELELSGSTVRLRLAQHLQAQGWRLEHYSMCSSSGYDAKSMISSLMMEHTCVERWSMPDRLLGEGMEL